MWGWRSQQTTQTKQTYAPSPAQPAFPGPKLSLERFLADPSPLPPSPRGPMPAPPLVQANSGNKEMWPPPSCQAGLPPVGSPTPLTGSNVPGEGMMPDLAGVPAPSQPSSFSTPATAHPPVGRAIQPAWGISIVEPKAAATTRRGSVGMPALPAAWASHLPAAQPVAPPAWTTLPDASPDQGTQAGGGSEEAADSATSPESVAQQLPLGWASAVDTAETLPSGGEVGRAEHITEIEAAERGGEDDAVSYETLLKNLKAARKALLWERAVAQRLRQALDMAEAWAPAHEASHLDSEAGPLRATIKLQEDTIAGLQQQLQDARAGLREKPAADEEAAAPASATAVQECSAEILNELRQLREKLVEAAAGEAAAKEAEAAASAEAAALRARVQQLEESTASASDGLEELRQKVNEAAAGAGAAQAAEAAASAEACALKDQVKQLEDSTASAIRDGVQELRQKLKDAEAQSQDASKKVAEEAAAATEASVLRDKVKQLEDSTASAIRDGVQELRQKLKDAEAQSQDASKKVAEEAAAEASVLRDKVKQLEVSMGESAEEAEQTKAKLARLQKTLLDSEAASEDLRLKLANSESAKESLQDSCMLRQNPVEGSEPPELAGGLEHVTLNHVEASTQQLEKLSSNLREHLRRVGESSADQEASAQNFGVRLRSIQVAAADKENEEAELWAHLRHVEAGHSDSELPEALRAKLREVVLDASQTTTAGEGFQVRLRHVEAAAAETQAASEKLQVQLRHAEASSAHLEDEVQALRVKLIHRPRREVDHAAVQTEGQQSLSGRTDRKGPARKTVLFGEEEHQSLPGSVVSHKTEEEDVDEEKPGVRRAKSRIKSVDFQRMGSAVSYVLESEEERSGSEDGDLVASRMSTMSQYSAVSEYYDTYNETSQPCHRRSRGTLETYDEEDLWDPEHVAMVTRKLFLKHDKDGTGRIEWESGEAIKFLEEFFWLHKQPPPKIPKPAFHSLYSQVKMDSKESDASLEDQETGLNIEEMTAFASKVHQFVYKQLGKEMREQRKSFAISTGDTEVLKQLSMKEAAQDPSRRGTQRRATLGGVKLQDLAADVPDEEEVAQRRVTQRRATLGGARLQDAGADDGEVAFQRLATRRATRVGVNLREMMAAEESLRGGDGD